MTTSSGKHYITAHHAWAWYREGAEPLPVPDRAADIAADLPPTEGCWWPRPPAPAPCEEQLLALVDDAAAQARSHLLTGMPLECSRDDDAVRLAAVVPRTRVPEIAERIGLDVAELRDRIRARSAAEDATSARLLHD